MAVRAAADRDPSMLMGVVLVVGIGSPDQHSRSRHRLRRRRPESPFHPKAEDMDLTRDEKSPERTRRGPGPWARFLRHRLACGGAVFLGVIILAALLAPWVGRHDPFHTELEHLNQAPDAVHWLGTDLIGRDVWSRVIHGSRTSLTVGILAVGPLHADRFAAGSAGGIFGRARRSGG